MSHAVLSPSAASRWMACTPSARLELKFPDTAGDFAKEGTLAHEIGELRLRSFQFEITERLQLTKKEVLSKSPFYSEELEEYANGYAAFVWERFQLAQQTTPDAKLHIEEKIDLRTYVPEGFGTGDAVILADGTMEIIDLKYGKGVRVSAENNKQMMLYALGALDAFDLVYYIKRVRMTIYQPRLDNISEWEMDAAELEAWGVNELKPRAEMAFNGDGEFVPGSHCRFCRAKAQCRVLAEKNIEVAKHESDDPALMTTDEVAAVLAEVDGIKNWITAVEEYALQAALDGKQFPGFKLVEGRSNRKYGDEVAVAKALLSNGFVASTIYEPQKLKGITALEKTITKKTFTALLSDLIIKPQGKPTLVSAEDKRQEWSSAANDFSEIEIND